MARANGKAVNLPPHNQEAEQALLGTCLRDNAILGDVVPLVRADEFYVVDHRAVYTVLVNRFTQGLTTDAVVLGEELHRRNAATDRNAPALIADLWDQASLFGDATRYAKIVREVATLRSLIDTGQQLAADASARIAPADELLQRAQVDIHRLADGYVGNSSKTLELLTQRFAERLEEREKRSGGLRGLSTGYLDLDEKTSGLQGGGADRRGGQDQRRQDFVRVKRGPAFSD